MRAPLELMPFTVLRLVLLLAFLAVPGQASAQRKPVPISSGATEFDAGWAVVAPPRGERWYRFEEGHLGAVYGKNLGSNRHTMFAIIAVRSDAGCCQDLRQLLEHVRRNQEDNLRDPRFREVEQEVVAFSWDGLECVTTRFFAQDLRARAAPGEALNFAQRGIGCLRPGGGQFLSLQFSERGGPREGTPELTAEGDAFLRGLRRRPPP